MRWKMRRPFALQHGLERFEFRVPEVRAFARIRLCVCFAERLRLRPRDERRARFPLRVRRVQRVRFGRRAFQQVELFETGDGIEIALAFAPDSFEVGFMSERDFETVHCDEHVEVSACLIDVIQRPNRLASAAYTARRPIASPPSGRPGAFDRFHAIRSKCAHGTPCVTKPSRNSAAVMAPAYGELELLTTSATLLSSSLRYGWCSGMRQIGSATSRPACNRSLASDSSLQ